MPLARGDVDAICCFEPYVTFAEVNGFGKKLWVPYDAPMGTPIWASWPASPSSEVRS